VSITVRFKPGGTGSGAIRGTTGGTTFTGGVAVGGSVVLVVVDTVVVVVAAVVVVVAAVVVVVAAVVVVVATVAAVIFPVVFETLGAQQATGKAKSAAFGPARVKPSNVTECVPKVAVESKLPVPAPTSVTPTGVTPEGSAFNNPVKTAAVEPPWFRSTTSGNTSMC
jgi:hypothetical protein